MEVADGSLLFLQKTNELSFSLLCLSLIEPKALHFVSFSSNSRQSHLTICAPWIEGSFQIDLFHILAYRPHAAERVSGVEIPIEFDAFIWINQMAPIYLENRIEKEKQSWSDERCLQARNWNLSKWQNDIPAERKWKR